jgi:hypothetical protein
MFIPVFNFLLTTVMITVQRRACSQMLGMCSEAALHDLQIGCSKIIISWTLTAYPAAACCKPKTSRPSLEYATRTPAHWLLLDLNPRDPHLKTTLNSVPTILELTETKSCQAQVMSLIGACCISTTVLLVLRHTSSLFPLDSLPVHIG